LNNNFFEKFLFYKFNLKAKSSHKNLSKANTQTTSNPHINSNSNNTNSNTNHNTNSLNNNSNNMQILSGNNKNFSNNNNSNSLTYNYNNYINNNQINDSNYNSERPPKKTNKNFVANESNELTSNFSDIVNFEDLNQIIKKPQANENYISNPYKSGISKTANEHRKKSSSRLEIGDLDVNETKFRNLNNFSHKHSKQQIRNSTLISGKNISNISTYSQNEKENNNNYSTALKQNFDNDAANADNRDIFDRLNLLKQRTKFVLAKYSESFGKMK